MPGFIRSNKDEARWKRAKKIASKSKDKSTESFSDRDWALVNHIYQNISKGVSISSMIRDENDLNRVIDLLQKAKFSFDGDDRDYDADNDEDMDEHEGLHTFNPEEYESDDADDWLKEHDPAWNKDNNDYEEYGDDENEDVHRQNIENDIGQEEPRSAKETQSASQPEEVESKKSSFRQPTRDELIGYRKYTRPFVERAKDMAAVQADARLNPELAARGHVAAARNIAHGDRKEAYNQLINSPEYQNADEIRQMEMDDEFEKKWRSGNPDHIKNALDRHHGAHKLGEQAQEVFEGHRDEQIKNILEGGHSPDAVSMQEGLQHAGGIKGEEGVEGAIVHDPAARFAQQNQEFLRQFARDRETKQKFKNPTDVDDMEYDTGAKKDMARILGPAPTKDPKFESFFAHYHPLISIKAKQAIKKQGLDPKNIDLSMLHEAGMHGLFQAVNDYDHDNPSKASFATHAGNKIEGLQRTALKNMQLKDVPSTVLQQQKKFERQQKAVSTATPSKASTDLISHPKYIKGPDVDDRKKRIDAHIGTTKRRSGEAAQIKPISQPVQTSVPTEHEDEE